MGRSFYKELQERLLLPSQSQTTDPSPVPHLQVVSIDPDLVVPLEFVYEFDAPSEQAAVCPDHLEALKAGRCPKTVRALQRRRSMFARWVSGVE